MSKVDKGFEFIYWNLSYRRKFIRTIWMTPLMLISILFILIGVSNIVVKTLLVMGLAAIYIGQLVYTYKKWKKDNVPD